MALTNAQIGEGVADLVAEFVGEEIDHAGLVSGLSALFVAAGLTATSEAAAALARAVAWNATVMGDERAFFTTAADGGPESDGRYLRHYEDGSTALMPGLAKLVTDMAGVVIAGRLNNTGELPAVGSRIGEVYLIGVNGWVWTGAEWFNAGPIQGPSGPALELRTDGGQIQWRVVGASSWTNLYALADLVGADGPAIELRTDGGQIQWRVVGASSWTNLYAVSDLVGPAGPSPWTAPADWATDTAYVIGPPASLVRVGGETYVCLLAHTSDVFADDLAAGRWFQVAERGPLGLTPAFDIGEVATLPAGSEASATITGTPEAPLLNLNLVRGDRGAAFSVDAIGPIADREDYDAEAAGFSYFADDEGLLYFRSGETPGVWSVGIEFGKGDTGEGVPAGGTAGQVLKKIDGVDFNTAWGGLTIANVSGLSAALTAKLDAAAFTWGNLGDRPSLFSGVYDDLTGKPTLGTAAALNTGTSEGDIPVLGVDGKIDPSLYTAGVGSAGYSADLAVMALAIAELKGNQLGFGPGVADDFSDADGVDAGGSSNEVYESGTKLYTNYVLPGSAVPQLSGYTSGSVTVSADSEMAGNYQAWRAFNRAFGGGSSGNGWAANGKVLPKWLKVDFGAGKTITAYALRQVTDSAVQIPTAWQIEGSNDDSGWTTLDSRSGQSFAAGERKQFSIGSPGSYRYYRFNVVTAGASVMLSVDEWELFESTTAWFDMDLRSVAYTAITAPTAASLAVLAKPDGGVITPGTHLKGHVSRDGGTTWSEATLVAFGAYTDGSTIYFAENIDLTAQPSGTAMKWRVEAADDFRIDVMGVVLRWRT